LTVLKIRTNNREGTFKIRKIRIFSLFFDDTVPELDGQTDRQTDGIASKQYRTLHALPSSEYVTTRRGKKGKRQRHGT